MEIINFVPGQICIVLHCERVPTGDALERLYERTRLALNERLAGALPKAQPRVRSNDHANLERDVAPLRLSQLARAGNPALLLPLKPRGALSPWQVFDRRPGEATVLSFFGVRHGSEDASDDAKAGAEIVRELVNFLNNPLDNSTYLQDKRIDESSVMAAATPNWYIPASPCTCGGPGGEPAPVPPGGGTDWTFQFRNPAVERLVNDARRYRHAGKPTPASDVVVAVLDTCPSVEQVQKAAAKFEAKENWLLHDVAVAQPISLGAPPSISYPPDALTANWRGALCDTARDAHHYLMPDHGLFVSGIVRDIAPAAEIHLIRALDDDGVGTLQGLTQVLSQVVQLWGRGPKKLIVNLSLMADIPTYSPLAQPDKQRLLTRWFPTAFQAGVLGPAKGGEARWLQNSAALAAVQKTLGFIHQSLFDVVESVVTHGILVVGACGNDGSLDGIRPNPRFPAAYDSVLGVAALARHELGATPRLASYTNLGDEAVPLAISTGVSTTPNGVAVWGGNSVLSQVCADCDDASRIDLSSSPIDAVRGIFTSEQIPISGEPNQTGWAYWVGTSFATPVITGLAADLWAAHPQSTASEISQAIQTTLASGTIQTPYPGEGPGPLTFPFIDAYQ
ncbi:MAG TPA: S8 family serine peptidase [Chloroflexota bacterium]|nr:S8 family serine peptidase [Chloroflexota bacterium]